MRRAELFLAGCVAVCGCMKIYPDPELPDVRASWYLDDCQPLTGDVVVALDAIDDPAAHIEMTASCSAAMIEFAGVRRERYRVKGTLLDAAGAPFAEWAQEADLRNGVNADVWMSFGNGANVRIEYALDMGATCASLNAGGVVASLTSMGEPFFTWYGPSCDLGSMVLSLPEAMYEVEMHALRFPEQVVATSSVVSFDVVAGTLTRVGPVTLVPCGASCPTLPR